MELISVPVQATPNLTSFTTKLKKLTDKRDNRGKRHELAFMLGGVVLAIMSGRSDASTARPAVYPEPAQVVGPGVGLPGSQGGFPGATAPHFGMGSLGLT